MTLASAAPTPSYDDLLATRLLHQRVLVAGGALDDGLAHRLCSALLLLAVEEPQRDVALHLHLGGGTASAAAAVVSTMGLVPVAVRTVALGTVGGVATRVLRAGEPGRRCALPGSRVQHDDGRWLSADEAVAEGLVDVVAHDLSALGAVRARASFSRPS